jgi:hypothetical protein
MPYISTERVAEIRNELNATFPDFKFRCYREHNSTINVVIVSAPFDFLEADDKKSGYYTVNHMWIEDHFKAYPELKEQLLKIHAIITKYQGAGHMDGDYGHVPTYYEHIYVGEYNKPFEMTTAKAPGIATAGPKAAATANGVTIAYNTKQNGIEISFTSKPAASVLQQLKDDRFRWSRFNKVWYITDNASNRLKAAKYGTLPAEGEQAPDNSFDEMVIDQEAERIGA